MRNYLVTRTAMDEYRDLVRHRARRQEDRGLVAQQGSRTLNETIDGGVFEMLLVANDCIGDHLPHRGRRARLRIAVKIDELHDRCLPSLAER